jgi:hypothetical protein
MLVPSRDLELTLQDVVRPEQLHLGQRRGRPRSCLHFALGGPSVVGGGNFGIYLGAPCCRLAGVDGRRWWAITDSWTGGILPFRANTKRGENPSPYCKHPNRFLSLLSLQAQGHAYPLLVSSVRFALTDSGATARLFVQVVSYFNTSPSCVRNVQYQFISPILFDAHIYQSETWRPVKSMP